MGRIQTLVFKFVSGKGKRKRWKNAPAPSRLTVQLALQLTVGRSVVWRVRTGELAGKSSETVTKRL